MEVSFLFHLKVAEETEDPGHWTAMGVLRMLSNMRHLPPGREFRSTGFRKRALAVLFVGCLTAYGRADPCTTQAKMTQAQRTELGTAAFDLATAVQAGDSARVQARTVAQYAGDVNQTAYLVRSTGERVKGDTLTVSQLYLLDATARKAGDSSEADFSCPLSGTVAETDFGIAGLPPGRFAFAMVEAQGGNPWLLAFLLQQEGTAWKMAGFYPRPRTAAGHDGLWYWTTARADAKASKPWLAWVLYGEADELLRPAAFVSSGNLEKLRSEQRTAAPQPLTNGLSAQAPLSLQGPGGAVYRVSDLKAQASDDTTELNLWMHLQVDGLPAGDDATALNVKAAQALLAVHPELREGFSKIWVVAEAQGRNPVTTQRSIRELAAVSK